MPGSFNMVLMHLFHLAVGIDPTIMIGDPRWQARHRRHALETKRIDVRKRIAAHITVRIDATLQPNWIRLDIPPRLRIIIPVVVVMYWP